MYDKLSELRARRAEGEGGFTLIELLVVVVIIGILIAIAIPLYLNYEKSSHDKAAESDLRNAISVFETCNTQNGSYPTLPLTMTASASPAGCTGQTIELSGGTDLDAVASGTAGYTLTSKNTGGSGAVYCYNSATGGSVTTTANALGAATC